MSVAPELLAGDLARLTRLRDAFLAGRGRSPWRDERDLELYDAVFGQRIAWKWAAVLDELARRGFVAPAGEVLDFGCGTGVAARAWLTRHAATTRALRLHDSSELAAAFAAGRVRRERPELQPSMGLGAAAPATLLVSHVLSELAAPELEDLVELARGAQCVAWVEPGSRDTSRDLSKVRDALLGEFAPVAPCTHRAACPVLAPEHGQDWCHSFARAPAEVYTTGSWARIGNHLGIDLRSLPYSFVVLLRRELAPAAPAPEVERLLGRARVEKGRLRFQSCGSAGLRELRLLERDDRALFDTLEDSAGRGLTLALEAEDGRVRKARSWPD